MRVIAQTGWGQAHDRRQTEQAGFDDHLVKPVDLALLEDVLREDWQPRTGSRQAAV
jgi:two-component system CheB/CheR fusion protein